MPETQEAAPAANAPQTPSERLVNSYETGTGDFDDIVGLADESTASTAGASSEPAPASTPAPVPSPPAISPDLLERARSVGFSDTDIAEMTPAAVERATFKIEQKLLKDYRQEQRDQAVLRSVQPTPSSGPAPSSDVAGMGDPAAQTASVPQDDEFAEFEKERDQYAPFFQKLIDRVRDLTKEVADLRGLKTEYQTDKKRREMESFSEACDRFFAQRPEVYGKGTYREVVAKEGPDRTKRLATIQTARLTQGATWEEKMAKADAELWGEREPQAPEAPLQAEPGRQTPPRGEGGRFRRVDPLEEQAIAEFRNGALARPTQRDEMELPPGPEKAKRTAARIMSQMDQVAVNGAADEANADDFPD